MISISSSVCVDAPARDVWARLARLEDIQLWSEAVLTARCDGERSRGIGAQRTCELAGGITIEEHWVSWDEGRSFAYEGIGIPLLAHARNEWSVQPQDEMTLLTTRAEVVLKGGRIGRLLEPVVEYQIKRVTPKTLAAFKHLVEDGEPPKVKHAKLPPAPMAC